MKKKLIWIIVILVSIAILLPLFMLVMPANGASDEPIIVECEVMEVNIYERWIKLRTPQAVIFVDISVYDLGKYYKGQILLWEVFDE